MSKINVLIIGILMSFICAVNAQTTQAPPNVDYHRSSLSLILLDTGDFEHSGDFKYKDVIMKGWEDYPFPDKYDKNEISTTVVNSIYDDLAYTKLPNEQRKKVESQIKLFEEENRTHYRILASCEAKLKEFNTHYSDKPKTNHITECEKIIEDKNIAIAVNNLRIKRLKQGRGLKDPYQAYKDPEKDIEETQVEVGEMLKKQRVGHQLVREWFSAESGKMFDMSTMQKRGFYNASMLDVNTAKLTVRGMATLADAGEELIDNTFVAVTSLEFIDNSVLAGRLNAVSMSVAEIGEGTSAIGALVGTVGAIVSAGTMIASLAIKDGYSVFSKTYLYKLVWNDTISAAFYSIWGDEKAFNKLDFPLEFVGGYYERSQINAGVFSKAEDRQVENILNKVLVRNIDKVFATLQRENDIFKPKIPILSTNPITAEIGMKEGLEGGEKFEVLEIKQNPGTGLTTWARIGVTTVDKDLIWDNRYNAGDEPENPVMGSDGKPITVTTFKGGIGAQPGMLLRQIK
jgi:hypothetical protein